MTQEQMAKNLREKMNECRKKVTINQLAINSGVNYNTIIKLLNGSNKNPTLKTIIGIAGAMKMTVKELLGDV